MNCGYKQFDDDSFISPENFKIHFLQRNTADRYAIASITFETNMPVDDDIIKISEHLELHFQDKKGAIIFK